MNKALYPILILMFFVASPSGAAAQNADSTFATKEQMKRIRIPLTLGWDHNRFLFFDKWNRNNVRGTFKLLIDPPGRAYFRERRRWLTYYKSHPKRIATDFP